MLSPELLAAAQKFPTGVLKILGYADGLAPDAIIICDRGARPIGRTMEFLAEARGVGLPTPSGTLDYKHVTQRSDPQGLSEHLRDTVEAAARNAGNEPPMLLVIDDHIHHGHTGHIFRRALRATGVEAITKWATYTGKGADFTPFRHIGSGPAMPWLDQAELLGVEYPEPFRAVEAPTPRSIEFYGVLRTAASEVVAAMAVHST